MPIRARGEEAPMKAAVHEKDYGFTRIELIAVLVIVALLGGLGLPLGATTKSQADISTCLDHNRQLARAWTQFALDNNDTFATTPVGMDNPVSQDSWGNGWVDWSSSPSNTNSTYFTDPRYSGLANFLARRKEPFKCPADRFLSAVQRSMGWTERVRSVAANGYVGGRDVGFSTVYGDPYLNARTFSQLVRPPPSEVFVFLEEHPDSLNDCAFYSPGGSPSSMTWWDYPASYHDGGAMFSFADGHAELHRWIGPIRTAPVLGSFGSYSQSSNLPDQLWLYQRTPRAIR
jgi:prepilin-type processing-associated H-X9-DG protein